LEDDKIRWPNTSDFCSDVVGYWFKSGGLKSQQETDAYFAKQLTSPAAKKPTSCAEFLHKCSRFIHYAL
jgi:hypothetical protein